MKTEIATSSIGGVSFETIAKELSKDDWFCCIDQRGAHPPKNRYSIIAANPSHTLSFAGGFVTVDGHTIIDSPSDSLKKFAEIAREFETDSYLPFSCGLIGYAGFEGCMALAGMNPASGFSRHPQCRFGIYECVVIFDHIENRATIVANCADRVQAQDIVDEMNDRLYSAAKWKKQSAVCQSGSVSAELRMIPSDSDFLSFVRDAYQMVRADALEHIHVVRHANLPRIEKDHLDAVLSQVCESGSRGIFLNGSSIYTATSNSNLFAVDDLKKGARVDDLIAILPPRELFGAPSHAVDRFIDDREEEHRFLYGGIFGTIDGRCMEFMAIEMASVFTSDSTTISAGSDIRATSDVQSTIKSIDAALVCESEKIFS